MKTKSDGRQKSDIEWQQRSLIEEIAKRNLVKKPLGKSLRAPEFTIQNQILDDPARFKALNATRRAAKSETEVRSHIEVAMKYPWSKQIYMGITRESVAEICWDVFKRLDEECGIGMKFNNADYVATFPNNSKVRLFGADVSHYEMRKVLGQKVRKVSVDEAGSFNVDLENMVKKVIRPTLIDLAPYSWLTLLGTCENIPNTYFERVTSGLDLEVKWKIYRWSTMENPFLRKQWIDEISELTTNNPNVVNASWFKTHYLNEWCTDDNLLIIPVTQIKIVDELPEGDWNHVLGIDLGYNDDTAFSVLAYSENSPNVYCVDVFKSKEMDFTDVAERTKLLMRKYDLAKITIDGANKQGVEELRRRHGLPLHSAIKSVGHGNFKSTALRLLRDDIICGNFRILRGAADDLLAEWGSLQWADKMKIKEDIRCANHASDATLYGALECFHWAYTAPEARVGKDTDEFMNKIEEKEAEEMDRVKEGKWFSNDDMDAMTITDIDGGGYDY